MNKDPASLRKEMNAARRELAKSILDFFKIGDIIKVPNNALAPASSTKMLRARVTEVIRGSSPFIDIELLEGEGPWLDCAGNPIKENHDRWPGWRNHLFRPGVLYRINQ